MAWIRLDDDYIYHPKFKRLSDRAFRLWHEGMAYSRKLLSDGIIPREALRDFSYAKRDAVTELLTPIAPDAAALWRTHDLGFAIHDYLQWNPCRDEEVKRREDGKVRLQKHREKKRGNAFPNAFRTQNVRTELVQEEQASGSVLPEKEFEEKPTSARSKRPFFKGQKLVVFEWMVEDAMRILGNCTDYFDLHAWFFNLDARMLASNLVQPDDDRGIWFRSEVVAEAQRRGLPIAVAAPVSTAPSNKRIAGLVAGGNAFLNRNS